MEPTSKSRKKLAFQYICIKRALIFSMEQLIFFSILMFAPHEHEHEHLVILLIFEYAIAVESGLVQRNRSKSNESSDNPVADRLDRGSFGFDQDYFERMPLLVNAMQESTYSDTSEISPLKHRARYLKSNFTNTKPTVTPTMSYKTSPIRRTSPRPFIFEYRSPTPTPFSQTYGSRSWVESYRNAQRLKNLQQVIKYLEKTINAKFGDMYTLPTSTHIAFSGVYVEPVRNDKNFPKTTSPTLDLLLQNSNKAETFNSNHESDPLYSFKPESPGDVNLLADGFWRFSPVSTPTLEKDKFSTDIPMFRPITHNKRNCIGFKCKDNIYNKSTDLLQSSSEEHKGNELPPTNTPKSFSVMLNLFPMKPTNMDYKGLEAFDNTPVTSSKIRITTSRPTKIQFRRRSTTPIRRTSTLFKRPRILSDKRMYNSINIDSWRAKEKVQEEPKMVFHVNVYPTVETKAQSSTEINNQTKTNHYVTEIPILTSTQVEDYHLGSSGIIPVEARLTPVPAPPISTSTLPTVSLFDTATSSSDINVWSTNFPDVVKFSAEDAKVPDHYTSTSVANFIYKNLTYVNNETVKPEISRRNSKDKFEINDEDEKIGMVPRTLIVKLKNEYETNTKLNTNNKKTATTETVLESKEDKETTTVRIYVPQINGHYRSMNQNSKNINSWLNSGNRKRRLEMSVTGFRKQTYVPQYVEIIRNNTRNSSDEDI